ncbi:MAG: hypothetical protein WDN06_16240 [Asticcacaulis sp.]
MWRPPSSSVGDRTASETGADRGGDDTDGFTVTDRRRKTRADSVTVPWTAVRRVTVITSETGPFIDSAIIMSSMAWAR